MEYSIMRREVSEEVAPVKRHLKRENTFAVIDKPCLADNSVYENLYAYLDQLGEGSYGIVRRAYYKGDKEKKKIFAVKSIEKNLHPTELRRFLREIEILKTLDHPNIIKFYEVYESGSLYNIVLECCQGGDLGKVFEIQQVSFIEDTARNYMWQILLALNYLHGKEIAHRDIKPENFLISSKNYNKLKLIDFGLSGTFHGSKNYFEEIVGSPFYLAPEVLERNYTSLCDIWSAGVILYNLMTCKFPFDSEHNHELYELIKIGLYDKHSVLESGYSKEARDLLFKMLIREKDGRISASMALQHEWFKPMRDEIEKRGEELVTRSLLENIRKFGYNSLFQREMVALMAQGTTFEEPEIEKAYNVFMYIDKDLNGTISTDEIAAVYNKLNIKLREGEIEEIVDSLYFKEKAVVTYMEFIAATLDKEFYQDKQRIRELFNYIDVDLSGEIDKQDIKDCFKRFGRLLDEAKINRMIRECDFNEDNKISFDEFYHMIITEKKRSG